MKKILSLIIILFANYIYCQELTVTKSYLYNNSKEWQLQDEPQSVLKRVTFYKDKGIGFVFGDGKTTTYYDYKEWDKIGNIYNLENSGGVVFSIEFNADRTKVKFVYVTMDATINDERLGEVTRKSEFRFEVSE